MKLAKYILTLTSSMMLLVACYKNNSTYNLTDREEITVTGIESSYQRVSVKERLEIQPTVTSNLPGAEFEYFWGIYETNLTGNGAVPKLDTIARTKDLDYLVVQPAKVWMLVFCAQNIKTGYRKYVNAEVTVTTEFTRGWYVLKDDGAQTDVDMFVTPSSIIPTSKVENVFSNINGRKLDGKALQLNFYHDYKSDAAIPGTFANTRAMFLLSDKDAAVVNINSMGILRDFSTLFYDPPAVKAPMFLTNGGPALIFNNNGRIHSFSTIGSNKGRFPGFQLRDNQNSDYYASKYFLGNPLSNCYIFDETSSSFLQISGGNTVLNTVTDGQSTELSANRNNKTLLYLAQKNNGQPYVGYGLFQDKTNSSLKTLSFITPSLTAFTMTNETLQPTDKIYSATKYALNNSDEDMIYFVVGNEIWSRNLSNKFEQLQYTVPQGETITFLRHRHYSLEPAYSYNYIMVGSTSGGKYKVRMFTKTSGNLSSTPVFTLEGDGSVGDVIYISPSVTGMTYANMY